MTDEVWAVMCETVQKYRGLTATEEARKIIERDCQLVEFDGGAFVLRGNEVDVFVTSQRRKRWATRKLLDHVFGGLVRQHGRAVCGIHKDNADSLRFATKLGFTEYARAGDVIHLELTTWKSLAA